MNAMQTAAAYAPTTIGELKALIQSLEEQWSEQDERFLGQFDHQSLYVCLNEQGIAPAFFKYCAEFGLVAFSNTEIKHG